MTCKFRILGSTPCKLPTVAGDLLQLGSGLGRGPHCSRWTRWPWVPPASPDTAFCSCPPAVEKLADCKLNVAEVTQSEIGQKQKLQTVLEAVQDLLRPHGWALQWTVDCECCWEREPVLSVVHLVTCHRLSLALKRSIHAPAL